MEKIRNDAAGAADPRHLAVILDGNGRWAERRGLSRVEGHREGALNVLRFIENMQNYTTEYLTLYAFSTENWKRSEEEVHALMSLLCSFLDENLNILISSRIRLLASGRIEALPEPCRERLALAAEKTGSDFQRTLILALNYGGRSEIVDAARKIAKEVREGKLSPDQLTEESFSRYLYFPDMPDPDLLIRTSGEMRLSNFLLWELSYAELYFTETLWPDFDRAELEKAMLSYRKRNRRFGGRK